MAAAAKMLLAMALGVAVSSRFGHFWVWAMFVALARPVVWIPPFGAGSCPSDHRAPANAGRIAA